MPRPVFVAVHERERHPQRCGLHVTRLAVSPTADVVNGVRLATAAETLLSCAVDCGVLDLVALADSALRLGHCTTDDLLRASEQRRWGVLTLRAALPLLDARSESAWESVLRVLHSAAEVDVEPQHESVEDAGVFVARADLWLVGTRRIHENDGEGHRDQQTHRKDLDRDRRLLAAGWERAGWTAHEVLRRGSEIIASADAALGRPWDPQRLKVWRA